MIFTTDDHVSHLSLTASSLPLDSLFTDGLKAKFTIEINKSSTFQRIFQNNETCSISLQSLLKEFINDTLSFELVRSLNLEHHHCFITTLEKDEKKYGSIIIIINDTNHDNIDQIKKLSHHISQTFDTIEMMKQREQMSAHNNMQFLSFFKDSSDPSYIIDPETFTILDCNKAIKDLGADNNIIVGKTCYRELYSKDKPCMFCSKSMISENDDKHDWLQYDTRTNRYLHLHDYGFIWNNGKKVYLETVNKVINDNSSKGFSIDEDNQHCKNTSIPSNEINLLLSTISILILQLAKQ